MPDVLIPAPIRLGFFCNENVGEYIANFFVGPSSNSGNVFVFNWISSIAASSVSPKYYAAIVFELMEIPSMQPSTKLCKLTMLAQDHSVMPSSHLANFAEVLKSSSSTSTREEILQELYQLISVIPTVSAIETQLTDLTAAILRDAFPELNVSIEGEDPDHASNNKFTPFHRSRRDITLRHMDKICKVGNNSAEGEETNFEYLTLEGKKRKLTSYDEYQLLSNMEIAAADVAKHKLNQSIEEIIIYGALLDYQNDIGRCYELTMNFVTSTSRILKQRDSQLTTIAQAMTYYYIC